MDIPLFSAQADMLNAIASMRSGFLNPVFLFLNYFDSEYFLMALIPFLWIGVSHRWGLRVAILVIISTLINYHLKLLFGFPRPGVDFPNLPLVLFSDPGFPSGGAQTATLLGSLFIYACRRWWAWVVGIFYILLISFSRLYLGVHYPMDVLAGIALGLALFLVYIFSIPYIDELCRKEGRGVCIVFAIAIGFLYAFVLPSARGYRLIGAFLGFAVGAYASLSYKLYPNYKRPFWNRITSGIAAILGTYALYYLTPSYTPPFVQSFILALWVSLFASPFCNYMLPKKH